MEISLAKMEETKMNIYLFAGLLCTAALLAVGLATIAAAIRAGQVHDYVMLDMEEREKNASIQ
jgi:ABC-type proline/glycine betaine transport system permease subunit